MMIKVDVVTYWAHIIINFAFVIINRPYIENIIDRFISKLRIETRRILYLSSL